MTKKLPTLSSRELLAVLRSIGFEDIPFRGKGSHHALAKRDFHGNIRMVIVPERKSIPKGTLLSILKQAGLNRDEFIDLFRS